MPSSKTARPEKPAKPGKAAHAEYSINILDEGTGDGVTKLSEKIDSLISADLTAAGIDDVLTDTKDYVIKISVIAQLDD